MNDLLFDSNVVRVNNSMYKQKTGSPKTKNATRWISVKLYVMEMLKARLNGRTPMVVIKKWIGPGSEEMVKRYTHLRPKFMQGELDRVPDYVPKLGTKIAEFDPI